MSRLHICNTFFEAELESTTLRPLAEWMRISPVVHQLQFLPLLLENQILVTDLPENPNPRLCTLDNPPLTCQIEDWGPSLAIKTWAKSRGIPYEIPDWEIVKKVNSKIFSFEESPKIPGATLLHNPSEVSHWIVKTPGPKVLKTAYGTAGRGHFHVGKDKNLEGFLKKQTLPVIGEPWVERVLDFSTQWKDGELLGTTIFENEQNGTYKCTIAGPWKSQSFDWALEEHLAIAKPLVEKIKKLGFSGNLGIDAYIYRWEGKEKLQPVVEINGRKTMSWVALQVQKNRFPEKRVRFSYKKCEKGLLPSTLQLQGRTIRFPRQISLAILD